MSETQIKSRFHILHLEVSHGKIKNSMFILIIECSIVGSDRYEIHLHMQRSPLVRDLMEEVEKKSRVTMINQQLLYRGEIYSRKEKDDLKLFILGQRLHQTPDKPLEKFGLFNGNRIILIGEKVC